MIATATSLAHLRGLARFIDEELPGLGLARLRRGSAADDDEWLLIDLGGIIVHLMTESARSFYELEKLWFQSPAVRVDPSEPRLRSDDRLAVIRKRLRTGSEDGLRM